MLLNFIKEKEREINSTLAFVARTNNFTKSEKNAINRDLRELYIELKWANELLDAILWVRCISSVNLIRTAYCTLYCTNKRAPVSL